MDRKAIARIGAPEQAKQHPRDHGADQFDHLVLDVIHVDDDDLIGLGVAGSLAGQADQPSEKLQLSIVGGRAARLMPEEFILRAIFQSLEARHHLGAVVSDLPITVRLRIQDGEVYCIAECRKVEWQVLIGWKLQILQLETVRANQISIQTRRVGHLAKVDRNIWPDFCRVDLVRAEALEDANDPIMLGRARRVVAHNLGDALGEDVIADAVEFCGPRI